MKKSVVPLTDPVTRVCRNQTLRVCSVRVALGARSRDLLLLVVSQALKLSAVGTTIGLTASPLVSRPLSAFLYETSPYDLGTFLVVPAVLVAAAVAAGLWPAFRAARVDAMTALKAE